MKKYLWWIGVLFILTSIGCTMHNGVEQGIREEEQEATSLENNEDKEKEKITIWSYYGGWESVIEEFNKYYPDIEVEAKSYGYEQYVPVYLEALVSGDGPDIMVIDSTDWSNFNTLSSFEVLSQEPYTANDYKEDFDKEMWEVGKMFGEEDLIGLPFATAPIVTYYRADILEEYGFPSEPEALGKFMESPSNWMNMARTLGLDGKYICQWASNAVWIANSEGPYFDENLNFIKLTPKFKETIKLSHEIHKDRLALYADIWMERGKAALEQGELVMLYLGSWGANELQALLPEQEGLWRVTRLPFNIYGWNNSTIMSMPKNSKNKDAAWKFIEFYNFQYKQEGVGSIPGYLPFREDKKNLEHENPFLGGQKDQKVYHEVLNLTREYAPTPLDKEAFTIWERELSRGLDEEFTAQETIDNIEHVTLEELGEELEILKEGRK